MCPADKAAGIAVRTVKEYLDEQDGRYGEIGSYIGKNTDDGYRGIEKVIFNVFSDRDLHIYERILEK
jgi:O-acetyl-ADP-ribose deacetylase (regulator of RNase III)